MLQKDVCLFVEGIAFYQKKVRMTLLLFFLGGGGGMDFLLSLGQKTAI